MELHLRDLNAEQNMSCNLKHATEEFHKTLNEKTSISNS